MDVWKQFEENDLTHSAAHHLLAVMELRQEQGYARVTDVARHLNITAGSASTNLKNLKNKGLITEDNNRFLVLSDHGQALARAVVARRDIFKSFLINFLRVDPQQAEIDACKTEHLLSHETSEKLLAFMKLVKRELGAKSGKLAVLEDHDKFKELCGSQEDCQVCGDHCLLDDC